MDAAGCVISFQHRRDRRAGNTVIFTAELHVGEDPVFHRFVSSVYDAGRKILFLDLVHKAPEGMIKVDFGWFRQGSGIVISVDAGPVTDLLRDDRTETGESRVKGFCDLRGPGADNVYEFFFCDCERIQFLLRHGNKIIPSGKDFPN